MPLNPKLFKGQLHLLYFLDLFIHSLRDSQVVSIQNMEEAFKQCCYERGSTDSSLKLMISSYIYIYLDIYPEMRLLGHMLILLLIS